MTSRDLPCPQVKAEFPPEWQTSGMLLLSTAMSSIGRTAGSLFGGFFMAHGTFLGGERLPPREPVLWREGTPCVFGGSSRTYGHLRRLSSMYVRWTRVLCSVTSSGSELYFSNSSVETMKRTHGGSSVGSQCSVSAADDSPSSPSKRSVGKSNRSELGSTGDTPAKAQQPRTDTAAADNA